jgi:hypothetical protein
MGILIVIGVLIVLFFVFSIRIVQEYDRGVIFFLGRCTGVRGPGLIILIPIFEKMMRVSLRTVTMEIPSQKLSPATTSQSTSQQSLTTILSIQKNQSLRYKTSTMQSIRSVKQPSATLSDNLFLTSFFHKQQILMRKLKTSSILIPSPGAYR